MSTTPLGFEKPDPGASDDEWGYALNRNFDRLDTQLQSKIARTDVLDSEDAAAASAVAAAGSQLSASNDAAATAADRVQTGLDAEQTAADRAAAETAADQAFGSNRIYPTTANALSNGVAALASVVAGSGGTDGTFPLAFSGGAGSKAAGVFVVDGGAVVDAMITYPGYGYTSAPTVSFAASAGLEDVSATAVIAPNTTDDQYFNVPDSDDAGVLQLWQNVVGEATDTGKRSASAHKVEQISDAQEKTNGLFVSAYSAPESSRIPLVGTTDSEGNVRENVAYDTEGGQLLVNGEATTSTAGALTAVAADLADRFTEQYASSCRQIVLAGTTDSAGDVRANVAYDVDEETLRVNGVPVGGAGLAYAPLVPLVSPPPDANVQHLPTYGQSLSKGVRGVPVHSTAQPYFNLTYTAGPRATKAGSVGLNAGMDAFAPLVEDTASNDSVAIDIGETPCSAWANGLTRRLAESGEDWRTSGRQFLGTANGRSSASIAQLLPDGTTAEGNWFQVFRDAIAQAYALSVAASKTYSMLGWIWMQGEGDNADDGYAGGVYKTDLATLHAAVTDYYQLTTGNADAPWLGVYQTYGRTARERPHATIDQIEYAEGNEGVFHLTALYHLDLFGDGHLTTLGNYWVGQYAAKRLKLIIDGYEPQWLRVGTATIAGNVITYRPKLIPVAPLRLRVDEHIRPCTDYGFVVRDDGDAAEVSEIAISADGRAVVITLADAPAGDVTLRYGLDNLPSGQVDYDGSAGGNLTDSDPETFVYDGVSYPLYNVCPHFQLGVIPV